MNQNIPPSLENFGEELDRAARRQLSPAPRSSASRLRRPRYLAGGTLGLAGIAAAATLAFSGGSAATAFAVTTQSNGTVQVTLNYANGIEGANAQLKSMGTGEQVNVAMGVGPASTPGAVTCEQAPDATGPKVQVLNGKDGTEVIGAGESGGNTAEGTFHIVSCLTESASSAGNSGSGASSESTVVAPAAGIVATPTK